MRDLTAAKDALHSIAERAAEMGDDVRRQETQLALQALSSLGDDLKELSQTGLQELLAEAHKGTLTATQLRFRLQWRLLTARVRVSNRALAASVNAQLRIIAAAKTFGLAVVKTLLSVL